MIFFHNYNIIYSTYAYICNYATFKNWCFAISRKENKIGKKLRWNSCSFWRTKPALTTENPPFAEKSSFAFCLKWSKVRTITTRGRQKSLTEERLDLDADAQLTKTIKTTATATTTRTTRTTTTRTMLLPWGDEQLATQRGEIRGRGRGGERRPNYTRYRPTSKEPTVPLLSEPSPPNGRPENNAPLPRIPQSSGGRRRPDYAFDTLFLLSSLFSSFPLLTHLFLYENTPCSLWSRDHSRWQNSLRSQALSLYYQIITRIRRSWRIQLK